MRRPHLPRPRSPRPVLALLGVSGANPADEKNAAINPLTNREFGERTRFWGGANVSHAF